MDRLCQFVIVGLLDLCLVLSFLVLGGSGVMVFLWFSCVSWRSGVLVDVCLVLLFGDSL